MNKSYQLFSMASTVIAIFTSSCYLNQNASRIVETPSEIGSDSKSGIQISYDNNKAANDPINNSGIILNIPSNRKIEWKLDQARRHMDKVSKVCAREISNGIIRISSKELDDTTKELNLILPDILEKIKGDADARLKQIISSNLLPEDEISKLVETQFDIFHSELYATVVKTFEDLDIPVEAKEAIQGITPSVNLSDAISGIEKFAREAISRNINGEIAMLAASEILQTLFRNKDWRARVVIDIAFVYVLEKGLELRKKNEAYTKRDIQEYLYELANDQVYGGRKYYDYFKHATQTYMSILEEHVMYYYPDSSINTEFKD